MVPASTQAATPAPDKGGRPRGPSKCERCRKKGRDCGPACPGWATVQPAGSAATPPPLTAAEAPQAESFATAVVDSGEQPHRLSERRRSLPSGSRDGQPETSLRPTRATGRRRPGGLFSESEAGEETQEAEGEEHAAEGGGEEAEDGSLRRQVCT
jgi:hypothetical protein